MNNLKHYVLYAITALLWAFIILFVVFSEPAFGYKNNREFIESVNKCADYLDKKYKTDINYNLKVRLRARIQHALKGVAKSKKTLELLGVPHMDFFKTWIECKFKEGMTWENRHLWHIDHIIPCSSFDLTKPEEQAKCFYYTNLQPLWASENLSKGNRIS